MLGFVNREYVLQEIKLLLRDAQVINQLNCKVCGRPNFMDKNINWVELHVLRSANLGYVKFRLI